MVNNTSFQQVTPDLLAESYLDTSCIEDYDQAVEQLASDIQGYVQEANWLESNDEYSQEALTHQSRIDTFAQRIWAATGLMAHRVCHSLL